MTHSGAPGVTDNDFVDDESEEHVEPEAEGLALSLFLCFALLMLFIAPFATRAAPQDKGWFQEPIVWPLVVLGIAVVAGLSPMRRFWSLRHRHGFVSRAMTAFDGMKRALLQAVLFCVYLVGIAATGFSVASLLYLQLLFWLSGLRGGKWPLIALGIGVAIIAVFRVGLGIWFPLPSIMYLLPKEFGNVAGEYL